MIKFLKISFLLIFIISISYLWIKKNSIFINKTQNYIFQQKINNIINKRHVLQNQNSLLGWIDIFWIIKNKYIIKKIKTNIYIKYEIRYNNHIYIKKIKILYEKIKFKKYIFF